jgi:hypothetical protein
MLRYHSSVNPTAGSTKPSDSRVSNVCAHLTEPSSEKSTLRDDSPSSANGRAPACHSRLETPPASSGPMCPMKRSGPLAAIRRPASVYSSHVVGTGIPSPSKTSGR